MFTDKTTPNRLYYYLVKNQKTFEKRRREKRDEEYGKLFFVIFLLYFSAEISHGNRRVSNKTFMTDYFSFSSFNEENFKRKIEERRRRLTVFIMLKTQQNIQPIKIKTHLTAQRVIPSPAECSRSNDILLI